MVIKWFVFLIYNTDKVIDGICYLSENFWFVVFQDKSAEFSSASSVGVRNTIFALLVCGIYEALMEYEFLARNFE